MGNTVIPSSKRWIKWNSGWQRERASRWDHEQACDQRKIKQATIDEQSGNTFTQLIILPTKCLRNASKAFWCEWAPVEKRRSNQSRNMNDSEHIQGQNWASKLSEKNELVSEGMRTTSNSLSGMAQEWSLDSRSQRPIPFLLSFSFLFSSFFTRKCLGQLAGSVGWLTVDWHDVKVRLCSAVFLII